MLPIGHSALAATAQPERHVPLISVLRPGYASAEAEPTSGLAALRQGLRGLGYIEGRTIRLEYRAAEWQLDRLPSLAAELVRLKPDVIVTNTTPAALAAKQAATVPIPGLRNAE
jgi:putative tryptophan/tyrosine transport system substrate-binding protein